MLRSTAQMYHPSHYSLQINERSVIVESNHTTSYVEAANRPTSIHCPAMCRWNVFSQSTHSIQVVPYSYTSYTKWKDWLIVENLTVWQNNQLCWKEEFVDWKNKNNCNKNSLSKNNNFYNQKLFLLFVIKFQTQMNVNKFQRSNWISNWKEVEEKKSTKVTF